MKFFHWELAFPDVFTPQRSGFDAMIGNPPWDVMKPNSQEFFTEFDPLYRTYDKQAALRKQKELFATCVAPLSPRAVGRVQRSASRPSAIGPESRRSPSTCPGTRQGGREPEVGMGQASARAVGFADAQHPFRLQGSADLNSYKMFAEVFWNLAAGRWPARRDSAHRHLLRLRHQGLA